MIIQRGKIFWRITDESVIAFDKRQATVYQMYGYSNKKPLEKMKFLLLNSNDNEYSNWLEVIALANKVRIRGYATKLQQKWFFEQD